MSRFGEADWDDAGPPPEFWLQAVRNALRGRRGQSALRELKAALLVLPKPRLIEGEVIYQGEVCALGALAVHRLAQGAAFKCSGHEINSPAALEALAPDLADELGSVALGEAMGLTRALAWGIAVENDDGGWEKTPERRYQRMLRWIDANLREPA